MKAVVRPALIAATFVSVAACAPVHPGEAFNKQLQAEIGKSVRDPSAMRNQYQSRMVKRRTLANGNLEEEYFPGDRCTFYFEIDPNSERIVGARIDRFEKFCIAN